jgi:hypothetical protein
VATTLVMGSVIGTGVFRAVVDAGPLRASQPGRVRSGHGWLGGLVLAFGAL